MLTLAPWITHSVTETGMHVTATRRLHTIYNYSHWMFHGTLPTSEVAFPTGGPRMPGDPQWNNPTSICW